MNGYEQLFVPSVGSPKVGSCCVIVSEGKVTFSPSVLGKMGHPKRITIHRGVNENEGKIVVEAAENVPGAILVDYDRKKICFYSKEIVEPLKDLIRKCVNGEFVPGIFFSVKGVSIGENALEFDFRDAVYRVVSVDQQMLQRVRAEKKRAASRGGKAAKTGSGGSGKTAAFSASSGFNMPNMVGRMT